MAQFDESKVINALHAEKAEIGKKYWYSDNIADLKTYVEGDFEKPSVLARIREGLFVLSHSGVGFYLLYPYEEPPKKRMTRIQFMEWLAKGNGLYKGQNNCVYSFYVEMVEVLDEEIDKTYLIRPFGQTEWIEPTVDIYERDCRGVEV